jgi:hypothetical protein
MVVFICVLHRQRHREESKVGITLGLHTILGGCTSSAVAFFFLLAIFSNIETTSTTFSSKHAMHSHGYRDALSWGEHAIHPGITHSRSAPTAEHVRNTPMAICTSSALAVSRGRSRGGGGGRRGASIISSSSSCRRSSFLGRWGESRLRFSRSASSWSSSSSPPRSRLIVRRSSSSLDLFVR